jgi:hypothetical protein
VWPFDRRRDVLRIGRERAELWRWSAQGLVRTAGQALSGAPFDAALLGVAIESLLRREPRLPSIDVVVESAWLPALAIEPGPALLSRHAVEALLLHRVNDVYGAPPSGVWQLQLEHRAGESAGLGFALASTVRSAIVDAAAAAGRRPSSIQPAFNWARSRLKRELPPDAWLLWHEQDRCVVARLERHRVRAMNAAAARVSAAEQVQRCVDIEGLRQGNAAAPAPVFVAGWEEAPRRAAGVTWLSVAAPQADPASPLATALERAT